MKFQDFKLLTDENIHGEVLRFLQDPGFDVLDVRAAGLLGKPDIQLLRHAALENRAVLTHDSDFGTLAVLSGEPITGIVYLRPGHVDPNFTIDTIKAILKKSLNLTSPFILVAQRRENRVTLRLRSL